MLETLKLINGWVRELVFNQCMSINLCCPSLHMRSAYLSPFMLAVGAGHIKEEEMLLLHK